MRTEEQKLTLAPIEVKLGTTEYKILVLPAGKTYLWREQLSKDFIDIFKEIQPTDFAGLSNAMTATLLKFPNKLADFIFSYSPELAEKRETILAEASEEQFQIAYSRIMEVGFPYLAQLAAAKEVFGR